MKHTLQIPDWLPPTSNQLHRGKIRRRIQLERMARDMVMTYAFMAKIPRATGKRRIWLRFDHGPGKQVPDVDAYFKVILDSCKHAGIIKDDSAKWLELEKAVLEKSDRTGTTITVEDIN